MWLKQLLIGVLAIGFLWSIAPAAQRASAEPVSRPVTPIHTPSVIRFRVIANSDNPTDQAVKLDVRDAVLRQLEPLLNHAVSRTQARRLIRSSQASLVRTADQVLKNHHMPYAARVSFTRTNFPTKAYGSWVLPAGRYQALLVVLGRGQGHNWWCVLFPSLCFIDMGNGLAIPAKQAVPPRRTRTVTRESSDVQIPRRQNNVTKPVAAEKPSRSGDLSVSWSVPPIMLHFIRFLR